MSFAGNWDIVLHTPMGKQKGSMATMVDGGALSGDIDTPMGVVPIYNGKVDGETATWSCDLTKPIALKLDFTVKVDGDNMDGSVKVGPMGTNKFEGTRK